MYSVLIVDDERPVIESITYMLQKNRPELQIAGTAASGREAIRKAEESKPDIILIDVKMPGIDGLDALREIKRRMPYMMPILMTAYERFDIAQTAFELGVQDYLLKPFSQEKLIAAVDAALQTLNRNSSGLGESLKHIELLHSLQGTIEHLFFKSIKLASSLEEFIPYLQTTLSLHSARGCIGLLKWELTDGGESSGSKTGDAFSDKAEQRIQLGRALLSKLKYKFPCLGSVSAEEILFFFPEMDGSDSVPREDHLENIFKKESGSGDVPRWNFALGGSVELSRLSDSCHEARQSVSRRKGENTGADMELEMLRSRLPAWRCISVKAVVQNEPVELNRLIETELLNIEDFGTARAVLVDLGLNIEHLHKLTTLYPLKVVNSESREDLYALCSRWFRQLTEQVAVQRDSSLPLVLRRALEYIDLYYSRPIQLADVALHVEVSPAYLSNLFSQHLGRSFIDQLTDCRINKAKQLLTEKIHPVKTISHMIGYQDPNYFSRLFRKWTGQSPTEYRP
ncbi:response regulator [Marispirochaeta sp.]|uniref:response regulator n=1 Tax=Marispirochaeta sp. TaxID=2038653 RepID=UPI0029C81C21|nr:response regulator [Marispirochaeta sp.]